MSGALLFLISLLVFSLIFSAILIAEFFKVTRKRRMFMASLGGSGRAVPRFKHTLIAAYAISTIVWAAVFLIFFFYIH